MEDWGNDPVHLLEIWTPGVGVPLRSSQVATWTPKAPPPDTKVRCWQKNERGEGMQTEGKRVILREKEQVDIMTEEGRDDIIKGTRGVELQTKKGKDDIMKEKRIAQQQKEKRDYILIKEERDDETQTEWRGVIQQKKERGFSLHTMEKDLQQQMEAETEDRGTLLQKKKTGLSLHAKERDIHLQTEEVTKGRLRMSTVYKYERRDLTGVHFVVTTISVSNMTLHTLVPSKLTLSTIECLCPLLL